MKSRTIKSYQSPSGYILAEEDDDDEEVSVDDFNSPGEPQSHIEPTPQDHINPPLIQVLLKRRVFSCSSFNCSCSCHSKRPLNLRLPPFLSRVLGNLFIQYTGYPITSSACDKVGCLNRPTPKVMSVYTFPSWLLLRTIHSTFEMSSCGWRYQLVARRRVQYDTGSILWIAESGDLNNLELFLAAERGALNDIYHENGWSSFHYAVNLTPDPKYYVKKIKILLAAGADPDYQDDGGSSVRETVATNILDRKFPPEIISELSEMFPLSKVLDDFNFSYIHKAVLDICPVDLTWILSTADEVLLDQVNARDQYGNTPLHYALDDPTKCRALLQAGADPNAPNYMGMPPLNYGVWLGKEEGVPELLRWSVDMDLQDDLGNSILHHIAMGGSVWIAERVISPAMDLNVTNFDGYTALHCAARFGCADIVKYLCEQGANLDIFDNYGYTPLTKAVYHNAYDNIQTLITHGAKYDKIDKEGDSILHIAAICADVKTTAILTAAKLRGLDTNLRNEWGYTPMEYLRGRRFKPEGMEEAFIALLESVEEANQIDTLSESADEQDVFFDAVGDRSDDEGDTGKLQFRDIN
jgi:ankyrin repeat protein